MTQKRRRRLAIAGKSLLTLAFVLLGVAFVRSRRAELLALEWPSTVPVLVVALAFAASIWLRSTYNWLVARQLGSAMTAAESFMLSATATAGSFILPAGVGMGVRAYYMNRVHRFPYSYFAGSTIVFTLLNIVVVSAVALLILVIMGSAEEVDGSGDTLVFGSATLVVVGFALFFVAVRWRPDGDGNRWWSIIWNGLLVIMGDVRLTVTAVLIVAANFTVACVTWTVALRDYLPGIRLADSFLISASQIISGFVTLTPGAVGFQEIAGIYVGHSLATSTVELFAVLVWVRATRIFAALLLALPSLLILQGRLRRETA